MKNISVFAIVVAIAATAFGLKISSAQSQPRFLINITVTETGAELTCLSGCAWGTLTFSCDDLPCEAGLDSAGVGPAHRE